MSKNSVSKNYIYNLTYQILLVILPLITTPYVSRVLGAENIGIYSYTLSIVTYFVLFGSLGISMYGQREIAYVQDNKKEKSKVFIEIVSLRAITMAISMICYYFTYINGTTYQLYYKILVIELLSACVDISWFFQGMEEFKKTVIRNIIVKFISVIAIFLFVKSSEDLAIYVLIYVLSNFLGNLSLWIYLPKYIEKIKFRELKIFRHLKPTIGLFIPQIAMQIYTVLDKTMIGQIVEDKSEVGYYEQGQKVIKLFLTLVTSLGTVMVPRMAHTFISGEKEKLKEYMKKSFQFVFFLAFPIMIGLVIVSAKFVPIFFGEGYDKVSILIKVISPIILFIGLSNIIGTQFLLPTKRQKEFTISVTAGAIINFILNMILIRGFQSVGASIATVFAELLVTSIQIYCIRDVFNIKEILEIAKNNVISIITMTIACLVIAIFAKNTIICLALQVIIGAIVYFATLVILKDEFIQDIIDRIKGVILRFSN